MHFGLFNEFSLANRIACINKYRIPRKYINDFVFFQSKGTKFLENVFALKLSMPGWNPMAIIWHTKDQGTPKKPNVEFILSTSVTMSSVGNWSLETSNYVLLYGADNST